MPPNMTVYFKRPKAVNARRNEARQTSSPHPYIATAPGLTETAEKCVVATGEASVFLPRVVSMPVPDPDKQPDALADAPTLSAGAEVENDTSSTPSANLTTGCTDVNAGGVSSASREEGLARCATTVKRTGGCGNSCGVASGGYTNPESTTYGMPLDLAFYSLKAAAGEKAKNLSPAEKLKGFRAICLHLAGQDPGDVHEALRLESGPNVSTNVAVSDGFLDKVRCSHALRLCRCTRLRLNTRSA